MSCGLKRFINRKRQCKGYVEIVLRWLQDSFVKPIKVPKFDDISLKIANLAAFFGKIIYNYIFPSKDSRNISTDVLIHLGPT